MTGEESQGYLKRVPPVAQLAENRAIRQGQWAISTTILATTVALAMLGSPVGPDAFLYKLLDELVFLVCGVLFIGAAINLYLRGAGRNTKVPALWGPLLLSGVAVWVWQGTSDDAFVPPVDAETLLVYAMMMVIGLIGSCAVLGLIYLVGRMFRPGEKKEIN